MELLVRYTHSVRNNSCIPWDEWGKGIVTVHLHPDALTLEILDTKVLVLRHLVDQQEVCGVDVYDLSRSGQRDIRVQQISEGVAERRRRVLPAPKCFIPCHKGDDTYHTMSLLGNIVYFIVSSTTCSEVPSSYSMLLRAGAIAFHRRGYAAHLEIGPDIDRSERIKLRLGMRYRQTSTLCTPVSVISNKFVAIGRIELSHLQPHARDTSPSHHPNTGGNEQNGRRQTLD